MFISRPRITIAALRGGSGKTLLSLGLAAELRERGKRVATFKKGPDFIDAGWLSLASMGPCHNLDPFLMSEEALLRSFSRNSVRCDLALIEGNRGLFDGMDLEGRYSTAEVAKLLKCPVLIILDVTMATRTVAAMLMGCQRFDPHLRIAGVVLNRVAGERQGNLVTEAIERYCDLPVLGRIPKLKGNLIPERHMGLVPHVEMKQAEEALQWARKIVSDHMDLDRLLKLAQGADPLYAPGPTQERSTAPGGLCGASARVGVLRDKAFWFYYPENLHQLETLGAELIEIDSLTARELPKLDALYIGGGFPEVQAEALAANEGFRASLSRAIEDGLPVYAECGGLMYLGEGLLVEGKHFPMVGALPITFRLEKRPQGHGYTMLKVRKENPYFRVGETLKGHEFHYSRPLLGDLPGVDVVFEVARGHGLDGKQDGFLKKNLLATYTHLHSLGYASWAKNFCRAAMSYKTLMKRG